MKLRVMAVCTSITQNCTRMWLARISLGFTPATQDRSSRPDNQSQLSIEASKVTNHSSPLLRSMMKASPVSATARK